MILGKSIAVIIPAYNAAQTLADVVAEIPSDIVDHVIVGDDASSDNTLSVARDLKIANILVHKFNRGYGANQKQCYKCALEVGSDIVIMVHSDHQYTPKLVRGMAALIAEDNFDVVLASRMLGSGALRGGMPVYKYFANRALTILENFLTGERLSEYHSGMRAFSTKTLRDIPYEENADGFIFDNQIILQIFQRKLRIGEVTCPTRYDHRSSSISFGAALAYGLQVIWLSFLYRLHKWGIFSAKMFSGWGRGTRIHK